ncbi:MAG: TRAP transporter substrate-binding protein DctP [Desulfobacterales bacterium]|nr:TRAP transporter substrate-binding protein DctP [Desulfobacterales bacterium]
MRSAEAIREMSDGRFDITVYPGDELVAAPELADALASGLIDFTITAGSYYKGAIPEMMLEPTGWPPLIVRSPEDQAELMWYRGLNDLIDKALNKYGIKYFFPDVEGPTAFWSKEPMYGVDDLKGFKMRLWGRFIDAFNAVGASAVYLPHSEVYTAIATGVLDGGGGLGTFYMDMNFRELCPYYYDRALNAPSVSYMASLDSWNELPDAFKVMLEEECLANRQKVYNATMHDSYVMKGKFKEWGTTVITWPDEELNKICAASIKILDEMAAAGPVNAEGMQIVKDFLKERGYMD